MKSNKFAGWFLIIVGTVLLLCSCGSDVTHIPSGNDLEVYSGGVLIVSYENVTNLVRDRVGNLSFRTQEGTKIRVRAEGILKIKENHAP